MVKINYIAANKYGVTEWKIKYWESQIEDLEKASKRKEKITIHKGPKLSEETINIDIKLLNFVKINRKLGIPLTTLSLKFELLYLLPDLLNLTSHSQLEKYIIDLCKEIIYL